MITSLVMSFIVFVVSVGIGAGIVSQDKSTDTKASVASRTESTNENVYTCHKFDAITQTPQGNTKRKTGNYDSNIIIKYTISMGELINNMLLSGHKEQIDTANFNKIADDGSRQYGNQTSNYFVYVMNESTIKVIAVNFLAGMTVTQICSK